MTIIKDKKRQGHIESKRLKDQEMEDDLQKGKEILSNLESRVAHNIENMNLEQFKQNSSKQMNYYCKNVFNGISENEIRAGLDVRAKKLMKCWEAAVIEMEKLNLCAQSKLSLKVNPQGIYTEEEMPGLMKLNVVEVQSHGLILSTKRILISLKAKKNLDVGFAILASGELAEQVKRLLEDPTIQEIGANIEMLKKILGYIDVAMEGVGDYTLKIIEEK